MRKILCALMAHVLMSCGTSGGTEPPASGESSSQLPAAAAGTSTEAGPGVPDDFAGRVQDSMELTASERAAVESSNSLAAARRGVVKATSVPVRRQP
jgi:hypothetical protein